MYYWGSCNLTSHNNFCHFYTPTYILPSSAVAIHHTHKTNLVNNLLSQFILSLGLIISISLSLSSYISLFFIQHINLYHFHLHYFLLLLLFLLIFTTFVPLFFQLFHSYIPKISLFRTFQNIYIYIYFEQCQSLLQRYPINLLHQWI